MFHPIISLTKRKNSLIMILPFFVALFILVVQIYKKPNNKYNVDTKPLKAFKWMADRVYQPIKQYVIGYKAFLQRHSQLVWLFFLIWGLNLNFGGILLSAIGYYLYFASSFNFGSLYMQFAKLVMDLQIILLKFPWYLFLPLLWAVFHRWRVSRIAGLSMNCRSCRWYAAVWVRKRLLHLQIWLYPKT